MESLSGRLAYQQVTSQLDSLYPMLSPGLLHRRENHASLVPLAWEVMDRVARLDQDDDTLARSVEAFATTSFSFLKLQSRFLRTGKLRATSMADIERNLYANPERMLGDYLLGLLVTYALWPNHVMIYRFFKEAFLPDLAFARNLLEIGTGHGLMPLASLECHADLHYLGLDLSLSSLEFAARLFARHGIPDSRYDLRQGNILDPRAFAALPHPEAGWRGVMCCEVLEHVDDPAAILMALRRVTAPEGRLFVTTVANLEAEDHLFLFEDEEQIRQMLTATGWRVVREEVLPLPGQGGMRSLNYAAVVRPD